MRYLKKYNEELKPETYLSAAQKLQKLGHQRRPEALRAYAEEIRQRQKEERHTHKNQMPCLKGHASGGIVFIQ